MLRRVFTVEMPWGSYTVEYFGRGLGWEGVRVDGVLVAGDVSGLWFIPRFDFTLGAGPAVIEVRVWPWLAIRSFHFEVDGTVVYREPSL